MLTLNEMKQYVIGMMLVIFALILIPASHFFAMVVGLCAVVILGRLLYRLL